MRPPLQDQYLPLHKLRASTIEARSIMPKTSDGVSGAFLSMYIQPGVSRSPNQRPFQRFCDLAFRLLPSRNHRKACEGYTTGILASSNLQTQNKLFDYDKMGLFSMSMTDLYAFSAVAELYFHKGIASAPFYRTSGLVIWSNCSAAIQLVCSCSLLMSELCKYPQKTLTGR